MQAFALSNTRLTLLPVEKKWANIGNVFMDDSMSGKGAVDPVEQKERATKSAQSVKGVKGVDNLLKTK